MDARKVVPYLTVNGATNAIAFYEQAFGATEQARLPADDGERLMHVELSIHGASLFLSDPFPEHDGAAAPVAGQSPPVGVAIVLAAPAEVDATYHRALSAGGKGVLEPADMFWGARFAMLTDPFGHRWMLHAMLAPG